VGQTNAGKSTLLNLILKEEKAIVSEIAGTTRDAIEDMIVLDGIQYRFIDTAGLRETTDTIESMGIERTYNKLRQASIVILMIDIRNQLEDILGDISDIRKHMDAEEKHLIVVLNKADMIDDPEETEELVTGLKEIVPADVPLIQLSAMLGTNIESLTDELKNAVNDSEYDENDVIVTNVRHFEALKHAHEAITRVNEGIDASIPGDLLAVDLRECLHYLGEITGEITTDEILGNIFKNFCIGK
jgi:tRNA modification GTPase